MKRLSLAVIVIAAFIAGCAVSTAASTRGGSSTAEPPDSVSMLRAEEFASSANQYYIQGYYSEAIEEFKGAFDFVPDYYTSLVGIALSYQKLDDLYGARDWYYKVYDIHPDSLDGYLGLGGVYLTFHSTLADVVYLDSAETVYREGLEKFPAESDLFYGVAVCLTRKGLTDEADLLYQEAIESNPESGGPRNAYVDFLIDQGRYEDALVHERVLVEMNPEDFIARKKLGDILMELKEYTEAIAHYDTLISLDPPNLFDGLLKKGRCYFNLKRYSDAEAAFKQVIEMDTTRVTPRIYLGLTYLNWGKEGSAESTFAGILEIDSSEPNALYYTGVLYVRRASRALNETTVAAWQSGCANARTATNYLNRAAAADSRYAGRANEQLQHLDKVRAELKKKLFLQGISDC